MADQHPPLYAAILGAHLDSTAGRSDARSPGADDNGSGSVTILEVLRVLATSGFKPHNTIELHWYAGEEGGLLGSRDVYAKYKAENKKVVAMLNQDMTGYSPSKKASVFVDYVDASLTTFVRKLVAEYTGVEPSQSSCGYGCSDHASATSNGFRKLSSATAGTRVADGPPQLRPMSARTNSTA